MGKAHVYRRDHINTDEIIPARYLTSDDPLLLARHCLEDLDPQFVRTVQPGDIIVGGEDFGCGSSREHAVWAIRGTRVSAVIASSFARIFYRNAIDCGFLVLELPHAADLIADGDELEIRAASGGVVDKTQGRTHNFIPLPPFALKIIEAGGLLNYLVEQQKQAIPAGHGRK